MTEEVTNQLSKLSGLRVISRAAVASFKDGRAELPRMVKELGIGSVVAGTVREDGTRVRVNVELIDARVGTGDLVRAVRSRGRRRVRGAERHRAPRRRGLNASVTLDEQARLGKRPTSSVAAYELFVRARNAPGEDLRGAAEHPDRSAASGDRVWIRSLPRPTARSPTRSYFQAAYGDLSGLARGLDAAHKALAIDPQLASAHHGLAMNLQQQSGGCTRRCAAHRKAVELDPSDTGGLIDLSFSEATAGRYDEALKHSTRALELQPEHADRNYHVGVALLCLDDDARTERYLDRGGRAIPQRHAPQVLLAFLDLRRGQPQAAVERIRAAAEKAPNNIEVLLTRAEILTFAGAADAPEVVRSLARARGRRPVPQCAVPGQAGARLPPAARRVDRRRRRRSSTRSRPPTESRSWPERLADGVHAERGRARAPRPVDRRRSTSSTAPTPRDGGTGGRSRSTRCSRRSARSRDSRSCCRASRPTSRRCGRGPTTPGCRE